jgi:hypothetical protein
VERRAALALGCALALALAGCGGGGSNPTAVKVTPGLQYAVAPATDENGPPSYTPTGRVIADSGFRPAANGFNFPNYGPGYQDLAAPDVADLYGSGPEVCASGSARDCQLTPVAEAWMYTANQGMAGGHCFGFSVTALMMYQHLLNPLDYGGPSAPALPLPTNTSLQERIAESFVLQISPRVRDAAIEGTPNQVLDGLTAALGNPKETYTLGIFSRDHSIGHAVTPYAIEDKGGGKFAVLIYDNNFPGITRAVDFDRNGNTWSYEAARNPAERSILLEGDAQTQTASLLPTTPGAGVQPCPFCNTSHFEQISLGGDTLNHAHLVMTDSAGRKTGYVDGKLVNQIPGAQVLPLYLAQNWRERPEPIYRIPRNTSYSITLDGSQLDTPDPESVSVLGPGFSAVASNLTARPDQQDQIQVTGNGTAVAYRTAGVTQRPHIEIGLNRAGRALRFSVATPPIQNGSGVTAVAQPATGKLTLDATGARSGGSYSLAVTQIRRSGARTSRGRNAAVPAGGTTQLRFTP